MGTPSANRQRLILARQALTILRDGRPHSRRDLFSETRKYKPTWQLLFLNNLIRLGIVFRLPKAGRQQHYVVNADTDARIQLDALLGDQAAIGSILWPRGAHPIQRAEPIYNDDEFEPDDEADNEPDEKESRPDGHPEGEVDQKKSRPDTGSQPNDSEILLALLQLGHATIENLVYLRNQVQKLQSAVEATQQQIKEIRDAWID